MYICYLTLLASSAVTASYRCTSTCLELSLGECRRIEEVRKMKYGEIGVLKLDIYDMVY